MYYFRPGENIINKINYKLKTSFYYMINVKIVFILIAIACLALFASPLYSQRYSVHSYSIGDGLHNNYVHDVKQDNEGRMWFATETGISMYDGYKWTNFGEKEGLANAEYYYLAIDKNNIIWGVPKKISSNIHYYKNGKWNSVSNPLKPAFPNEAIFCVNLLDEGEEQHPCFGSERGLLVYKNGIWETISQKQGLVNNRILDIVKSGDTLYLATENGISIYSKGRIDNKINERIKSPNKRIFSIEYDPKTRRFWIWGDGWLGEIKGKQFNLLISSPELSQSAFLPKHNHLTYDKKNKLFFGNEYFVFSYMLDTHEINKLGTERGFSSSGTTGVFVDREGNLWFPHMRGIDKIENRKFQNFYRTEGLLEDEVSSILYISPGHMVFGHNEGLTILRGGQFKQIRFEKGNSKFRSASRVMDICRDSSGNIWFTVSIRGLGRLNGTGIEWIKNIAKMQLLSVICDSKGKIWIGGDDGLYTIENGRMKSVLRENLSLGNLKKIYEGEDNSIIMVRVFGLVIYKNGKVTYRKFTEKYPGNTLLSLYRDTNGTILAGSSNGLFKLENDGFRPYTEDNLNLNGIKIYFINKDKKNNFWFGTNNGVYKWNGKYLKNYNLHSGLAGREANRSAFAEDERGRIWIGCDAGLSCYSELYETDGINPNPRFYPFVDEDGNEYNLIEDITLSSTHRSLTFNFSGISFVDEDNMQFRVRLSGFDKDWIEVGENRYIRYTNVPPGRYRFLVQARNLEGSWSHPAESGLIKIKKPFYNQVWFILLVIAAGGTAIYFSIIVMARLKYGRKLEEEVKLRTKELAESEEKLLGIQKIARVGYIDWDMKSNEMIWSDEVYTILGCTRENFNPSPATLLELIHPDEQDLMRNRYYSYGSSDVNFDLELRMKKLSGKQIWVRFVGKYAAPNSDSGPRMITALLDITRLKQAQLKLKEYSETLNKSNSAKDKLFSVIAHDLRSPYLGILGIIKMALSEFDMLEREELKNYFEMLNNSLNKQYFLLNNLLNWAKLQMGKMKIETGPVVLYDEAISAMLGLAAEAESRNIYIINSIDRNKVVFTDREIFNTALQNLLTAALRLTGNQGHLTLTTGEKEDKEILTVHCSVALLSSAEIEKLLDEESMHEKTPIQDSRGMGLSMVLCRELIEALDGELVSVQADAGGHIFNICLPKSAEEEEDVIS